MPPLKDIAEKSNSKADEHPHTTKSSAWNRRLNSAALINSTMSLKTRVNNEKSNESHRESLEQPTIRTKTFNFQ
jgi:hypothetical protein